MIRFGARFRTGARPVVWGCLLATLAVWPPDRRDRAHARPAAATASNAAQPPSRRPNVLILIGDDHTAGTLGIDGDPRQATPRLDALARQGVRFDRAYCNAPLCTPSRQSIITGRFPHAVGVTRLATALPADALTLGDWLGDLGYDTAAFGKMHFNAKRGGDNHHGFADRVDTADWSAWLAANPQPGGDHQTKWNPFRSPPEHWLNAEGRSFGLPDAAMESSFYVRRATAFLQAHASDRDAPPFALVLGFYEPHAPFKFPDGWTPRFRPSDFPDHPLTERDRLDQLGVFAHLTPEQRRGIAASYYSSLAYLDRQVGRVLDALDAAGEADNTVVVYLGDNGYLLGEHGRFEKHCFYEAAVRVPLIVRWPRHWPGNRRVPDLVELVDVVPTLLDLIGAPLPPSLHGRSLQNLALGRPGARGSDVVVSEYLENGEAMARSDRYKLIVAAGVRQRRDGYAPVSPPPPGLSERLFDLQADPGETTDLSGRPDLAPVARDLRSRLLERLSSTREDWTPVPPGLTAAEALRWCLTPRD